MSKQDNKDKLRVYEYAKSLNMSSKEIITILKRQGITVNNHMSVMENDAVGAVERFFHDVKANAAARRAAGESGPAKSGGSQAAQQGASQSPRQNAAPAQPAAQQPQAAERSSSQPQAAVSGQSPQPARSEQAEQTSPAPSAQGAGQGGQGGQSGQGGNRPQGERSYQGGQGGNRPQGERSYQGGQGGNRPQGERSYQGGQGGNRPQGERSYQGGQGGNRPQGGSYQGGQGGNRPQGERSYQGGQGGNRPQGGSYQGGQGGNRSQGGSYQGGQGGNRPQGGSYQGGQGGNRPQGGSYQGGQGGNRPQGERSYQGGQGGNRPQGGSYQGGQGGNRPQGGSYQGGQGGSNRSASPGASSQSTMAQTPARAADRPQRKPEPARTADKDRKPRVGEGRPNRNASVPGVDAMDVKANEGIGGKRTKQGGRRFDDGKPGMGKGGRFGKGKQQMQMKKEKVDNTPKKIIVRGEMTVGDLAKLLHKDLSEVIKKLLLMGTMATINHELDLETIQLVAQEFGVEVELKIAVDEDNFELIEETDEDGDLQERPPVVTIMGHVDHGKTTLLDAIRETHVTEGEAGGITQHIGAYQVEINNKKITFLDTPGHEAFTSMRARGAQVTDITILVVAADDGVMPQTVEAINHAKAAAVPIIVAVNKIDKPGAEPDKIKQELTKYELVPEEWGGDTVFVNISAKQRTNLDELLEMILLVAEVKELRANPDKRARGTVIEAELDKGKGPVARVLIQNGTLKVGDSFIAGVCFGRIRAMVNDRGKKLKEAGPSTPVEITGLSEVPGAGDPFIVYEDERKARAIAERRASTQRLAEMGANSRVTLDDLYKHIQEGDIKDLHVIIKGDVQGSVEALRNSLAKIEVEGARVKILHTGAGAITESDVSLASASNAIIIGFNVQAQPQAKLAADQEKVDIRLHRIIYNVIEEIEQAMKGMLDPIFKESVVGHAEVRNLFKVTKVGTIAGCMVIDGKMVRNALARVTRDGNVVYEGKLDSLKRFKDDAKEVAQGYECGITLDHFNDLKEGDVIEAFVMESVER
ncbi:translation initiation factor IF-2 [Gorillibacterium massiliense]|uniref:translation initiation factor IF-2 n=1 Tax=Gorillibacterium massiliense TaxID=1280390 RepID=UPI0006932C7A